MRSLECAHSGTANSPHGCVHGARAAYLVSPDARACVHLAPLAVEERVPELLTLVWPLLHALFQVFLLNLPGFVMVVMAQM